MRESSLFAELKRRNMPRAAVLYIGAAGALRNKPRFQVLLARLDKGESVG